MTTSRAAPELAPKVAAKVAAKGAQRVAVVTGGSSDIGKAIIRELALQGCSIALQYHRNQTQADEIVSELAHQDVRALAVSADLSQEEQIRDLFKNVRQTLGPVEILINNAASRKDGPLVSMTAAKWDEVFAVVARGSFLCTKEALTDMTRKRFGRIVNISSVAALSGWAGQANYASAKAALLGLTRVTAREYGRYGITCNGIAPGFIETSGVEDVPEARKEEILAKAILHRPGTPEEIGSAVAYLCSEKAGFITGQILPVDGGFSL